LLVVTAAVAVLRAYTIAEAAIRALFVAVFAAVFQAASWLVGINGKSRYRKQNKKNRK